VATVPASRRRGMGRPRGCKTWANWWATWQNLRLENMEKSRDFWGEVAGWVGKTRDFDGFVWG